MSDPDDRVDGSGESSENDQGDDQTADTPDSPAEPMSEHTSTTDEQSTGRDIERYMRYALLGVFTLLALIALLRFYFAASNAIDVWVSDEYRSLFQAVFNLVVLLIAGIGISWQVRELK